MIPLCKAYINEEEIKKVIEVLESGWYTHGPRNKEFERNFAYFIGMKYAVSVNSCASALIAAIEAHGITGEIIIPSFTFVATANTVIKAGAVPVFADINYDTCNINPESVESVVNEKTKAIIPVHYAGQCCKMDSIMKIAEKYNLIVIEDSAETIGGKFKNKTAGSYGTGCFSFYPTKNITTGEGGIVTTNNEQIYNRLKAIVGHGIPVDTSDREKADKPWLREAVLAGYNFRMSNILAAIGVVQLNKINEMNRLRREKAKELMELLKDIEELELPVEEDHCYHVFQMFTIKLKQHINRDEFVLKLRDFGIGASVHFSPPVHLHEFYKDNYPARIPLPVTENVAGRIVTLPMFPGITGNEIKKIAVTVKELIIGK